MKPRLIASIAVGAAVVLGTTGCTFVTPQSTGIQYSAAEGVNVYDPGPLDVRNAFIVANEDGSRGNLVVAVVNETDESHTLNIEIGAEGDTIEVKIRVPANSTVSLGSDDTEPELLQGLDFVAGSDIPAFFASGDAEGSLVSLPILDGALSYLEPLVP